MAALLLLAACGGAPREAIDLPREAVGCLTSPEVVRDLDFQGDEALWAATPGGLLRLDLDSLRWKLLTVSSGLPGNGFFSVLVSSRGNIWAGSDRGAVCIKPDEVICYTAGDGLPAATVNALAEGAGGEIYAGTDLGAAVFSNGRWTSVDDTHEFARRRVMDIAMDIDGTPWFAKENSLTHRLGDRNWETFQRNPLRTNRRADLLSNSLLSIAVDGRGTKWIGTKMGLNTYDGREWRKFYFRERMETGGGLRDNWIETIHAGKKGEIWLAHGDSKDFDRPVGAAWSTDGDVWTYLTTREGLPSNRVYCIDTAPDGRVWLGTARGLARVDGTDVAVFRPPGSLPGNQVISLQAIPGDRTLALLDSGPVVLSRGRGGALPGCPGCSFVSAVHDGEKVYGAQERTGLLVYTPGEGWREEEHFRGRRVLHLERLREGTILATTPGGVFMGGPGGWSEAAVSGLPDDVSLLKGYQDPRGSLLILAERKSGDRGSILIRHEAGGEGIVTREVPPAAAGYPIPNRLLLDPEGTAWLVSPGGLYRYGDGWREEETPLPRGSLSAAILDSQGRIIIGGRDGGLYIGEEGVWREVLIRGRSVPGWITSLLTLSDEILLVGTADQGILRLALGGSRG
jgi:hypothetical protein